MQTVFAKASGLHWCRETLNFVCVSTRDFRMTFHITFIINRLFYGLYLGWLFLGGGYIVQWLWSYYCCCLADKHRCIQLWTQSVDLDANPDTTVTTSARLVMTYLSELVRRDRGVELMYWCVSCHPGCLLRTTELRDLVTTAVLHALPCACWKALFVFHKVSTASRDCRVSILYQKPYQTSDTTCRPCGTFKAVQW